MARKLPALVGVVVTAVTAVALAGCTGTGAGPRTQGSPSPDATRPTPAATTLPPLSGSPLSLPSPPKGTGINGLTVVRGSCPVVRAEDCPDRPITATLSIMDATTGAMVTTVESNKQGQFSIALPPGRYLLRYAGIGGAPPHRIGAMPVTVDAGRYTTITVRVDSGIR
jgi:hypothetical protein